MQEDESKKLIDEINLLFKRSNIKELHESSCEKLQLKVQELIELHDKQKKKTEKIIKNHASFLQQLDKRNMAQTASLSKKDMMLRQQSKMASMGEMMDAVAHQWKQPLNALSMMNDMLLDDYREGRIDESYIQEITEMTHMQISHMINTLNEFRTFFRPSKDTADFSLNECLKSVEILMKDELLKNGVTIYRESDKDIILHGEVNEFKHLFLNLISNTIDAFNEKEISQREIHIKSHKKDRHAYIEFEDNAGGIPPHVIHAIFKPNVTTKPDGKGTGIGLYMSSQIVQKHSGTIRVQNTQKGALFTITLKL
jgi:signal transduction histidine kinase